jgi:hypothetical protein
VKRKIILVALVFVLLLVGCATNNHSTFDNEHRIYDAEYRTYYESLNLSTPSDAVLTFVDVYRADDYPTVFLVFSFSAQIRWQQELNSLAVSNLIRFDDLAADRSDFWHDVWGGDPSSVNDKAMLPYNENIGQLSHIFDRYMLAAKKHGILWLNINGDVQILREERFQKDDEIYVDVIVRFEGIPDEFIFRTTQTPSSRWRVYQVVFPEGNQEIVPWAVPKGTDRVFGEPKISTIENVPRTYYESLQLSAPIETVSTFIDAYLREDFPTVFMVFSPHAQSAWKYHRNKSSVMKVKNNFEAENILAEYEYPEHIETTYDFDEYMRIAKKHNVLWLNIIGNFRILKEEEFERKDRTFVDVTVEVEGQPGEIIFRTTQVYSKRWRVYQVILPGGNEELLPWAVPIDGE